MTEQEQIIYKFMSDSAADRAVINEKLDQIIIHTKETNGRVHKLELVTDKLQKEMQERDNLLESKIREQEGLFKAWVWKILLIVNLAGSFIWIKESREAILHIVKVII